MRVLLLRVVAAAAAMLPIVCAASEIDVFLIAGQSNAGSAGDVAQSPKVPAGKVLKIQDGKVSDGNDPVGEGGGGSAWPSFGSVYYAETGRAVALIPSAVGGTAQQAIADIGAGHWDEGGELVPAAIDATLNGLARLRKAGYRPALRGVVWMQGETDATHIVLHQGDPLAYRAAFVRMIDRIRAALGPLPIFMIRIGTASGYGHYDPGYAAIRKQQEEVANTVPDVRIVFRGTVDFAARGLAPVPSFHFTQQGYNEMGAATAAAIAHSLMSHADNSP